jgi:type IVB pilus formation R64 PilN family outer membrane protein
MSFKYWEELKEVLNSIIGTQGNAIISPTMGTVTITTTPDIMATVADYLSKENKRLSRQIAINVQIYSVTMNQSEDFNVAFSAFLKNLSSFSGATYASPSTPGIANTALSQGNLGSLNVAILNGSNDPTVHAGDVLSALSTIGDASTVAQFPMTTLNNRPISRRVGKDSSYIATVNSNTTTSTTSSTLWTPVVQTLHDGFSLQLTPRLLDDGRILLQYSLSLVTVDPTSMVPTSFDTGDATIPLTLPATENRIFVQQSMLKSGQTLIIGGVDQEELIQNKRGVGSPDNFLLGGGVSSNNNHLMLFMAITPQVMDVGSEQERS